MSATSLMIRCSTLTEARNEAYDAAECHGNRMWVIDRDAPTLGRSAYFACRPEDYRGPEVGSGVTDRITEVSVRVVQA